MQVTHSTAFAAKELGLLEQTGWMAGAPQDLVEWMAQNGRWRRYASGAVICVAGDAPEGLFGLSRGAFDVSLPLVAEEPVTIFRAEPGFWFGEGCVLTGVARQATVCAALDCDVFHLPAPALRRLLHDDPRHWASLLELSQINAGFAVTLLAEALALSPRTRLARMLLRLADGEGQVRARQDDLARLIGMTRSSLQRALRHLTQSGALTVGYGQITVTDRAAVARIAAAP